MGVVTTQITLGNPRERGIPPLQVEALVDTGSLLLCVTPEIAEQLQLETIDTRLTRLADGSSQEIPYAGPLKVTTFGNRSSFTGAMVMGEQCLLGAVPMEDMDILDDPLKREIIPNPKSPDRPSAIAMGFSTSQNH